MSGLIKKLGLRCLSNRKLIFPYLIALFLITSCGNNKLELVDADADLILSKVLAHRGNEAVLLNFWATWCAPCVEEFPMIIKLAKEYKSQGLKVYFVSVDWDDDHEKVKSFLKKQGVSGISFLKVQENDNAFINTISTEWTGAIPFTILFDKRGKITDSWENIVPQEKFEESIRMAMFMQE